MSAPAGARGVSEHNREQVAARFQREVASHRMTVLHDDGLYRHLRFREHRLCNDAQYRPGSSFYWFDLITWPGCLAIHGDCGSYVFSREQDMFTFFRGSRINPQYWAEKVCSGREGLRRYDEGVFRNCVLEDFTDAARNGGVPRGLGRAVREEILGSEETYYEVGARQVLDSFSYYVNEKDQYDPRKQPDFQFDGIWEWDLTDWDWQFLWCCHAIQWGISQYDRRLVAA